MKGGYVMVDGRGVNINLGSGSSGSAAGLNADLAMVVNGGKMVIVENLKKGTAALTPAAAMVQSGTSGAMTVQIDKYLVTVTAADKYTVEDLNPPAPDPPAGLSATTDQLFVQTYLNGLADGATVQVIPAAHSQGRMFSLNVGSKSVILDFSAYTGSVSISCSGFTPQAPLGSKKWTVTGSISPWIQTESLTAITIAED